MRNYIWKHQADFLLPFTTREEIAKNVLWDNDDDLSLSLINWISLKKNCSNKILKETYVF